MSESITIKGRTGEIHRVESDGTTHVWFGDVRADGAHICEAFTTAEVYGTVDAAVLHLLKSAKALAVDARTAALIDLGFEFPPGSGLRFSLSLAAQSNLTNAFINRTNPAFTFPLKWTTLDSLVVIDIPDATTMGLFYGSALMTVRGHRDSGVALKARISAAVTPDEIEAVVDIR